MIEFNYTNLKRNLFINEFLYLSGLIWGSWNSWPLFLKILNLFGGNKSWIKRMIFRRSDLIEQKFVSSIKDDISKSALAV